MLKVELLALLERTSDAAFAVREIGEICFSSKAAERQFGYRAPDAVRKRCAELLDGHGSIRNQGLSRTYSSTLRCAGGGESWLGPTCSYKFRDPGAGECINNPVRGTSPKPQADRGSGERHLASQEERGTAREGAGSRSRHWPAPETEKAVLAWFRSRSMRSGFGGSKVQARIQLRSRESWALP